MNDLRLNRITNRQAIISQDTVFGIRDYFLVTAKTKNGVWELYVDDIDIDYCQDLIKSLKVDYSTNNVTGYCNNTFSFRDWWKSINQNEKQFI